MRTSRTRERRTARAVRAGFTLMEVNIALLVLAVGLIGLFSLFPVGLRQSDMATSDTAQAAFATVVFNAMHANAALVTNWTEWASLTNGEALGVANSSNPDYTSRRVTVPTYSSSAVGILADGVSHKIVAETALKTDGYFARGQFLKYELHIENDPHDPGNGYMKRAWIKITDRPFTDVMFQPVYCTAFVYMGM
jgi:Tfp pilus assembly protein PilV